MRIQIRITRKTGSERRSLPGALLRAGGGGEGGELFRSALLETTSAKSGVRAKSGKRKVVLSKIFIRAELEKEGEIRSEFNWSALVDSF
ncbi:hypothetical protein KKC1_03360 [Calderihabitans maritimus]|uniref:Uncharacterized protein n=1 Tax=Calderihabitans maritimus TaxID=1246530 RepID=A0A1Z5HNT7_9FIRM|nr:hypothetical protein KKC1_03360 [Calderihabitans maritimus]